MKRAIATLLFMVTAAMSVYAQRGPVLFDNHFREGVRVRIAYNITGVGAYQSWHFAPGEDPKMPCKCNDVCGGPFVISGDAIVQFQTDSGIRTGAYRLDEVGRWDHNHWDIDYHGSIEEMANGAQPRYFPNYPVSSLRFSNQIWSAQAPPGPPPAPLPPGKSGYTRPDGSRVIIDAPRVALPPQYLPPPPPPTIRLEP